MNITITVRINSQCVDISIDDRQKIKSVLDELAQSGIMPEYENCFLRLPIQERVVSKMNTFYNEKIMSGDIIEGIQ